MTGFRGQKFDFTGNDGAWYALISDIPSIHINMRVTAPVPALPEITYITGLSLIVEDSDGFDHSIIISVKDPHSLDSACPAGLSGCLANGALSVVLDGEDSLLAPGMVSLAPDVAVSVVNLPGACRSFGFEKYWERKELEYARVGRRLSNAQQDMDKADADDSTANASQSMGTWTLHDSAPRAWQSMGDWILGDPTATNMMECSEYVARATTKDGGLFAHQSEHASFQISTPTATIRLSHGGLHQLAMRDPTDQYDLPDHRTWQMNMAIDRNNVSRDARGILGETFVPTLDNSGHPIMHGIESISGTQEDCE